MDCECGAGWGADQFNWDLLVFGACPSFLHLAFLCTPAGRDIGVLQHCWPLGQNGPIRLCHRLAMDVVCYAAYVSFPCVCRVRPLVREPRVVTVLVWHLLGWSRVARGCLAGARLEEWPADASHEYGTRCAPHCWTLAPPPPPPPPPAVQSSNVAYRYGVSGPFWYAAGASWYVGVSTSSLEAEDNA